MITTLNRMSRALARAQTDNALEQVMADLDLDRLDIIGEETTMDRLAGQPSSSRNGHALAGVARLLWRQMGQLLMLIPEIRTVRPLATLRRSRETGDVTFTHQQIK